MSTKTVGAVGAAGTFDYTCDGTDDHTEINAAIAATGSGGTVQLSGGMFACTADISVTAGVSLIGTPTTILQFSGDAVRTIIARGANTIADLDLRGPVTLMARGSDIACARIISRQAIYGSAAFNITTYTGTIRNIALTDCHAIDTSGFGYLVNWGVVSPARIEDLTLLRCTAVNCGAAYDNANTTIREWVSGFDLHESETDLSIANFLVIDCHAEGCYESGFHAEGKGRATNCQMINCTSDRNGISKPSPHWGAGFRMVPGWEMTDCIATGNAVGIYTSYSNLNPPGASDPLQITRCQSLASTTHGIKIQGDRDVPITNVTLDECTVSGVAAPNHYLWLKDVIGATVTDLEVTGCTGDAYQDGASAGNTITYLLPPFTVETAAPVTGETVAFVDHSAGPAAWSWGFGNVRLQGSPVSRKAWTIDALADDHAEIEALAALTGQHLTLNSNGVEYPGVMIRPPMLETQLTPAAWAYQVGFVQETRR